MLCCVLYECEIFFFVFFLLSLCYSINRFVSCREERLDYEHLGVRFCFLISGICFFILSMFYRLI